MSGQTRACAWRGLGFKRSYRLHSLTSASGLSHDAHLTACRRRRPGSSPGRAGPTSVPADRRSRQPTRRKHSKKGK
jgi:hypothetical protein